MNSDAPISPRDFSEAVQELREEIRNDVRKLGQTMERRQQVQPGVSPMGVFASVVGALCVGAAGMSIYQSSTMPDVVPQSATDKIAELQTVMKPHTDTFVSTAADLTKSQQATAQELNAHRLLLDRVSGRLDDLQESVMAQESSLHEHVELVASKIAATLAENKGEDDEPTTVAKPLVPNNEESPVQPASAEADVAESEKAETQEPEGPTPARPLVPIVREPAGNDAKSADNSVVVRKTTEPERGELIIDNPSNYDLKLLVNGKPLEIKARGASTIAVTVGTVKIQSAAAPDYAKTWDNWETVEGVKRLTVNVESGDGYYNLR